MAHKIYHLGGGLNYTLCGITFNLDTPMEDRTLPPRTFLQKPLEMQCKKCVARAKKDRGIE